jgi:hypothetical protein
MKLINSNRYYTKGQQGNKHCIPNLIEICHLVWEMTHIYTRTLSINVFTCALSENFTFVIRQE